MQTSRSFLGLAVVQALPHDALEQLCPDTRYNREYDYATVQVQLLSRTTSWPEISDFAFATLG